MAWRSRPQRFRLLGKQQPALLRGVAFGPRLVGGGGERLEAGVVAAVKVGIGQRRLMPGDRCPQPTLVGVAEAQLYPAITLGGSITPSYTRGGGTESGVLSWSFGPGLTLPIFDGGALRANVSSAESTAREAYLSWKQEVLDAVEEVENALAAVARDGRTVSALRATVSSYQEALQLATASYRDGASSLLDVLDAQREVSTAQANLAAAVQQMAQDYVSLNVAIGGGYAVGSATTTQVASAKVIKD